MKINTAAKKPISSELLQNYFKSLVNRFFKILPIRESEGHSLDTYLKSLQIELLGCERFVPSLCVDADLLSLLNTLQYLIDNPDTPVQDVRREVFRTISICNKLSSKYSNEVTEQ